MSTNQPRLRSLRIAELGEEFLPADYEARLQQEWVSKDRTRVAMFETDCGRINFIAKSLASDLELPVAIIVTDRDIFPSSANLPLLNAILDHHVGPADLHEFPAIPVEDDGQDPDRNALTCLISAYLLCFFDFIVVENWGERIWEITHD